MSHAEPTHTTAVRYDSLYSEPPAGVTMRGVLSGVGIYVAGHSR